MDDRTGRGSKLVVVGGSCADRFASDREPDRRSIAARSASSAHDWTCASAPRTRAPAAAASAMPARGRRGSALRTRRRGRCKARDIAAHSSTPVRISSRRSGVRTASRCIVDRGEAVRVGLGNCPQQCRVVGGLRGLEAARRGGKPCRGRGFGQQLGAMREDRLVLAPSRSRGRPWSRRGRSRPIRAPRSPALPRGSRVRARQRADRSRPRGQLWPSRATAGCRPQPRRRQRRGAPLRVRAARRRRRCHPRGPRGPRAAHRAPRGRRRPARGQARRTCRRSRAAATSAAPTAPGTGVARRGCSTLPHTGQASPSCKRGRDFAGHVLDASLGQVQMFVSRCDIAVDRPFSIRPCPGMLELGRGQFGARRRLRDEPVEPRGCRLEHCACACASARQRGRPQARRGNAGGRASRAARRARRRDVALGARQRVRARVRAAPPRRRPGGSVRLLRCPHAVPAWPSRSR